MNEQDFRVPDECELIEFFGSEPIERAVEDGYWCYEGAGTGGTTLRFSMNLFERSVQTEIRAGASILATVSHELAVRLVVDGKQLRCEFVGSASRTTLTVDSAQGFKVGWSTLRTK
jgi:hypothetical protein